MLNNAPMTKSEALAFFDGSPAKLARALGITRSAVSQWPDDRIPEAKALRLRHEIIPAMQSQVVEQAVG